MFVVLESPDLVRLDEIKLPITIQIGYPRRFYQDYRRDTELLLAALAGEDKAQPDALKGSNYASWAGYNRAVAVRLGVAAAEQAARAYNKVTTPPEPEGFEFRFNLPGPGGFSAYQNRITGQLQFKKFTGSKFIDLDELIEPNDGRKSTYVSRTPPQACPSEGHAIYTKEFWAENPAVGALAR